MVRNSATHAHGTSGYRHATHAHVNSTAAVSFAVLIHRCIPRSLRRCLVSNRRCPWARHRAVRAWLITGHRRLHPPPNDQSSSMISLRTSPLSRNQRQETASLFDEESSSPTIGPVRLLVTTLDAQSYHVVTAQVILCQGCYFQRFEILKAHGVKGRRPLENQGILSISTAKIHQKLSWIKEENEVQFA